MKHALVEYLEGLTLSQGRDAGQPWRLLPWQRRFVHGAFSQPDDARLTIARGGGKTTFVAGLACAALSGPLVAPRAEVLVIASSFEQGLICYRHIKAFMQPAMEADPRRWRVQDSANRAGLEDRETGALLRVLGSDPRRLHGAAPLLIIADEPAQWPHTQIDAMVAALSTARGKIPGSRMIWLGTRASDPQHPFEKALADPVGYTQQHAAREEDPPFRQKTWMQSNPSLATMPDLLAVYRSEARRAKLDPAALQSFKALRLNQGTSDVERMSLLSAGVWASIEGDAPADGPVAWGADLGTTTAQSAIAAYWPNTGRLDVLAAFCDPPSLAERGLADGVGSTYQEMHRRGELIVTPGAVADVPTLLREALRRFGPPDVVAADTWRRGELVEGLNHAGIPPSAFVLRRFGPKDGGQDVRAFRKACLTGKVVPVVSLLMRSAMRESVTVADDAGNAKLSKQTEGGRRSRARDDAAAAAILAVAVGSRRQEHVADDSDTSHVMVG